MLYRFGAFRLDPERFELLRDGQPVPVEPQVFQFLVLLIRHRDRLVSKDEIVAEIWNGRAISDASISSRVRLARSALGDNGERQTYIRTIHGRGFRFIAPVTEEDLATVAPPAPPAQRRPSIAVLPLQAIGLSAERAVIADAISHDVIQALSRLRWLTVIARGSSFRFRGTDLDLPPIGVALNVRYILSGLV